MSVTVKLNESYLLVKKKNDLKKLNRQAGECYFDGRTDELCEILVEAMRTHEFVRVIVHYADEEYQKRYGPDRQGEDQFDSSKQLALVF